MAYACPNTGSKEWKMLVKQVGEELANMAFVKNGYEMPNVTPISQIKKAIGFKTEMENYAGMAAKLRKYNSKHGTSHSFDAVLAYGNTWRLTLKPNYLSVNAEKQRQRLSSRHGHFRVEGMHKPATETLYTPSPSEQAAGFFTEDGDFLPNADRNLHRDTDEMLAVALKTVDQLRQTIPQEIQEKSQILTGKIEMTKERERLREKGFDDITPNRTDLEVVSLFLKQKRFRLLEEEEQFEVEQWATDWLNNSFTERPYIGQKAMNAVEEFAEEISDELENIPKLTGISFNDWDLIRFYIGNTIIHPEINLLDKAFDADMLYSVLSEDFPEYSKDQMLSVLFNPDNSYDKVNELLAKIKDFTTIKFIPRDEFIVDFFKDDIFDVAEEAMRRKMISVPIIYKDTDEALPVETLPQTKLTNFLEQYGFEITEGESLMVNLAAKTISLDTADINQVAKAMAAPLSEMLSYSNYFYEIEQAVRNTDKYKNLFEKYAEQTGKRNRNTKRLATKEIFKELLESGFSEKLAKELNVEKDLLTRIKEFINNLIESLKGADWTTIDKNIEQIVENSFKGDDFIRLTKKEGYRQVDFQEAFDSNTIAKEIMTNIGTDPNIILTGSIAYSTQGEVYRKIESVVHDLDFINLGTAKEAETLLLKHYPNSIKAYSFPTENYLTDTYLVPPKEHIITDIVRRKGGRKIIAYNVRNSEGDIVGTYKLNYDISEGGKITNEEEVKTGTEAMLVDFFTDSKIGSANPVTHSFEGSDGKVYDVKLAHFTTPFEAKLEFSRFKDIWDYNRFVPKREAKSNPEVISIEDTDELIATAGGQIRSAEIRRKRVFENQIRKNREALAKAKEEGDIDKILSIKKDLIALEDKIENPASGAKRMVTLASKMEAFEQVVKLANTRLSEIEKMFLKPTITSDDLEYAQRIADLWIKAGDFTKGPAEHILLDEDEYYTPEIRELFQGLKNRAENISEAIHKERKEHVLNFVRKITGTNLSEEEIFASMKDMPWLRSQTLNIGRSEDAMVQAIYMAVQQANLKAEKDINKIWEELDRLTEKFLKKSGGNFEILKQKTAEGLETGRTINRFSTDYWETKERLSNQAFYYDVNEGKYKSRGDKAKIYYDWINDNTITFDVRVLFPDTPLDEFDTTPKDLLFKGESPKERDAHIAELKKHLGEKGFEFHMARQEKAIERFRVERRAIWEQLETDFANSTEAEKRAFFTEWLKEHSPYWGLHMQENAKLRLKPDGKTYYRPRGIQNYAQQVPRRELDGKPTTWYDKAFEKVEQDDDLYNYYNFIIETLNESKYLLPTDKQRLLGLGVLPTVERSIMDQWMEKGMLMGVTPFIEKFRMLQGTPESASEVSADVNPKTGRIKKEINVRYIEDTQAKIAELLELKKIEFREANKRNATAEESRQMEKEIRNELSQQKSWDITRVIKAHTLNAISYKHRSSIDSQINMALTELDLRNELQVNEAGKALTKDGKEVSTEGLKRLKEGLDYFLDNQHYGIGGRAIEKPLKSKVYTNAEKKEKKRLEALLETVENEEEKNTIQERIDKLGQQRTLSGIGDTGLRWMTLKGLGWNLFSGASNMGFGIISNIVQASDRREYGIKNIRKGYRLVSNSVGRYWSGGLVRGVNDNAIKIRKMMDQWNLLQTTNKELFDLTQKSSVGKLKRFGPYTIQERTEYLNYAPVMIAIMDTFTATSPEGKEVSLWDAYGVDGKLKEGFTSDVDEIRMVQKIRRVIEMNHGDYNNPLLAKKTVTGRALSQFRTWMFEGFANRFESERIDYALSYNMTGDYIRKGRYLSYTKGQLLTTGSVVGTLFLPGIGTAAGAGLGYLFGKTLGMKTQENTVSDTLYTLKHLARKLVFSSSRHTDFEDKFSKVDAANMRKNMTELYFMVLFSGLGMLFKGMVDDEEEKHNLALNFLIGQATRLQTDIAFYTNPLEFEKLTKTAVPLAQLIQDTAEWFGDVKNLFNDEIDDDTFRSGTFKGDSKAWIHFLEMWPGTAQGIRWMRTKDRFID